MGGHPWLLQQLLWLSNRLCTRGYHSTGSACPCQHKCVFLSTKKKGEQRLGEQEDDDQDQSGGNEVRG